MSAFRLSWPEFKSLIDTNNLNFIYSDKGSHYLLASFLGQKEIETLVMMNDADSKNDFEANYKPNGNKPILTNIVALPDSGGFLYRARRIVSGSLLPTDHEKSFDFTMPENLWITGFMIKCYGTAHFDYGNFKVIAPSGHPLNPYPTEILVQEYVHSWGLSDDLQLVEVYKGQVPQGLILRITIFKPGDNAVDIWMNALLHKKE